MNVVSDESFGIVPIHEAAGTRRYLLIQHGAGHWAFPKGHAEHGESPRDAALRELTEETGLTDVTVLEGGRFIERYFFTRRDGTRVSKRVHYAVARTDRTDIQLQLEEVTDYRWADYDQARKRLTFDEGRALLDRVERWLNGQGEPDESDF